MAEAEEDSLVSERQATRNLELGANSALSEGKFARFYVILNNVSKKQNVGTLLRSACAFGVREVLVAGSPKTTQFFGAQGTHKHVPVSYFESMESAVAYARSKECDICGVEIKPQSKSLLQSPFRPGRNVAFMLGNEGIGMSEKQCSYCDYFVYIPHYGDGTASLNVAIAASITFQYFAAWAQYPEHERQDEKFVVKEIPPQSGPVTTNDFRVQEARRLKKEAEAGKDVFESVGLFGQDEDE